LRQFLPSVAMGRRRTAGRRRRAENTSQSSCMPEHAASDLPLAATLQDGTNKELHECGICLGDEIPASNVVLKPCKCVTSFCVDCWDASMCAAPKCPTCRASIGFDYDAEKGEARFLLYDEPGSYVFPAVYMYKPGTDLKSNRPIKNKFIGEMSSRSRPSLLRLLRKQHGKDAEESRECVCGGEDCLSKVSWEERRVMNEPSQPALRCRPICDCCDETIEGTHLWTCKRSSIVHITGCDLCERCVQNPPLM